MKKLTSLLVAFAVALITYASTAEARYSSASVPRVSVAPRISTPRISTPRVTAPRVSRPSSSFSSRPKTTKPSTPATSTVPSTTNPAWYVLPFLFLNGGEEEEDCDFGDWLEGDEDCK